MVNVNVDIKINKIAEMSTTFYGLGLDDWSSSYRGIHLLNLTNQFKDKHLESAYQRYSQRQRQKSLVILNIIDIVLKTIFLIAYYVAESEQIDQSGLLPSSSYHVTENRITSNNNSLFAVEETWPMEPSSHSTEPNHHRWIIRATYMLPWLSINSLLIVLITCWKRFANDYLHVGATITWLIFTVQGKLITKMSVNSSRH
ncbi:Adenylate cyclase type 8 [Blomia tropicalis]|nr:Adenylate cyclase type 8 [Blomia tropicalis]